MRFGRFGSKSKTHKALFEQTTLEQNLDCTFEFRRPKIARKHIWVAANRDRTKSDPWHANRGKMGLATALFCKLLQNEIP